jgi:hypothetical protein
LPMVEKYPSRFRGDEKSTLRFRSQASIGQWHNHCAH